MSTSPLRSLSLCGGCNAGAGQDERLADFGQRDALGLERPLEAADRLVHRLATETERLVMNGDHETRARLVRHLDGLLGRAVTADPRVVRADRHGDDVDRTPMRDVTKARAR